MSVEELWAVGQKRRYAHVSVVIWIWNTSDARTLGW